MLCYAILNVFSVQILAEKGQRKDLKLSSMKNTGVWNLYRADTHSYAHSPTQYRLHYAPNTIKKFFSRFLMNKLAQEYKLKHTLKLL